MGAHRGATSSAAQLLVKIGILQVCLLGIARCHQTVDKWTVAILGGIDEANRVANKIGCNNLGILMGFNDVYLFEKRDVDAGRDLVSNLTHIKRDRHLHRIKREIQLHPSVVWVDAQIPQKRVKRDLIKQSSYGHQYEPRPQLAGAPTDINSGHPIEPQAAAAAAAAAYNDELWAQQWYLQGSSEPTKLDKPSHSDVNLRVQEAWSMGFTGQGVVVTVLDDGLERNHTDIFPNYDPLASWDMNNNRSDPFPRYDRSNFNSHGTRCAGEVAMAANNRKCGVGVAPRASIGGIKCLDGDRMGEQIDAIDGMSLVHNMDHIDIYIAAWGPDDNGHEVAGPGRMAAEALRRGTVLGRKGRGALYVFANGNGGKKGDNCNCDGWITSIYTIAIGGVSEQGQMPIHGERCASTLAVTCSDGAYTDRKIVTTDLHNKCTVDFDGSSAAAPLAAGIYALALEANRNITWRDAQHLTVASSNPLPLRDNPGWKRNGAGYIFNNRFGFGLMDAKAMVDAALSWQPVPKKSICQVSPTSRLPAYIQSRDTTHVLFYTDGCRQQAGRLMMMPQLHYQAHPGIQSAALQGSSSRLQQQQQQGDSQPTPVNYLEHVQVIVDIEYTTRGELDIYLVSPSGTISTLLSRRPLDVSRNGFDRWPLMSVHFWGESSQGSWTLIVRDKNGQNNRGVVRNATLVLHGTSSRPAHLLKPRLYQAAEGQQVPSFIDPVLEMDEDEIYDFYSS